MKTENLIVSKRCFYHVSPYVDSQLGKYFSNPDIVRTDYATCDTNNVNSEMWCNWKYYLFVASNDLSQDSVPPGKHYTAFFSPYHDNTMIIRVASSYLVYNFWPGVQAGGKNYFYIFKFNDRGRLLKSGKFYSHIDY